jgi:hypothetical protein
MRKTIFILACMVTPFVCLFGLFALGAHNASQPGYVEPTAKVVEPTATQPPAPTAVMWPTLVPSATPWPKPSRDGIDQLVQVEQKYEDHYSVDLTGTIAFSTYLEAYSTAYSICESYNFYKHSHVETAAEQAMMLAAQEFMTTQNCPQ